MINERHKSKTLDILLNLRQIIPHPPAAPMGYQELADALIDMGISTSYDSVYRHLKHPDILTLLGVEKITDGQKHTFRHQVSLLDKFSHHGLIADLIVRYLPHLLPPNVAKELKAHMAHHLTTFAALDDAYPDKRWIDKLDVQIDALGSWMTTELTPELEILLSALYRDDQVIVEYHTPENPEFTHTETILPQHLVVTTQGCELGYLSINNSEYSGKGKLSRMLLTDIHSIQRCY